MHNKPKSYLVFGQLGVARRRGPQHTRVALQVHGIDVGEDLFQIWRGGCHREEAVDDICGTMALHHDGRHTHIG